MIKKLKIHKNILNKGKITKTKKSYTKPIITNPDIIIAERDIKKLTRRRNSK